MYITPRAQQPMLPLKRNIAQEKDGDSRIIK